jgi:hypothetical protein
MYIIMLVEDFGVALAVSGKVGLVIGISGPWVAIEDFTITVTEKWTW